MKIMILVFTFLLILPLTIFSQAVEKNFHVKEALNLIEAWVNAQSAYDQIPGISMAIVHDQKIIWRYATGYLDPEKKLPANTNTIYSICSISKLFTAIALMQLRDKGLLRLDDPVGKHLPWFNIEQLYPDSPPVTIESILTHSSGLPRESDFPYWNAPAFDFPTREEMKTKLKEQKTLYPAYTYYQYSNLGLTLAGEIVAEVSGQDYQSYVTDNIIKPLGLEDTRPYLPQELHGTRLAIGYSAKLRGGKRDKMPLFQTNAITPAAGFSSTVEDLAKFAIWQMRLLEGGENEVLQSNTLKEMQRVHWLDGDWQTTRGLGFGVYRRNDITFVGHEGSCPGYRSAVMLQAKNKTAVIFMANSNGVDAGAYAQGAYRIIMPAIESASAGTKPPKQLLSELTKFTGTYSEFPWGGETFVLPWHGGLAMAYFPDFDPPTDLTKLKHIEGNLFRRIRSDGEPGEDIEFIVDEVGDVISLKRHSYFSEKVK